MPGPPVEGTITPDDLARIYDNSCRGKRRFPSRKVALGALRVLLQTGRARDGRTLAPYKCKAGCKQWHLGNSRSRGR